MSSAQACQWEAFFPFSFFTLGFLTLLPWVSDPEAWGCGDGRGEGSLVNQLPRSRLGLCPGPQCWAPAWEGEASYLHLRVRAAGAAAAAAVRV